MLRRIVHRLTQYDDPLRLKERNEELARMVTAETTKASPVASQNVSSAQNINHLGELNKIDDELLLYVL
jgi:hypothetical protein